MLDKIKQMFGVGTLPEKGEEKPNEATNDTQGNGNVPLTQDEYAQMIVRRLQQDTEAEAKRFKEEIEQLAQNTAGYASPAPPPAVEAKPPQEELPENPTVEDLLQYVNNMVERRVEERLQQFLMFLPKVPASSVVDTVVAKHPVLQSVADEAKQIFENIPREYQTEQTADFILWWLKGKRSEVEKKEAITELLGGGNHSTQAGNVTLPYTSEQIREWAEAMGIDPKRLRQRLLETMQK